MRAPKIIPEHSALLQLQRRLPDSNRSKLPEDPPRLPCSQRFPADQQLAGPPAGPHCDTARPSLTGRTAVLLAVEVTGYRRCRICDRFTTVAGARPRKLRRELCHPLADHHARSTPTRNPRPRRPRCTDAHRLARPGLVAQ